VLGSLPLWIVFLPLNLAQRQRAHTVLITVGYALADDVTLMRDAPMAARLRITVKHLGDHSARLGSLRSGTRVIAEGPCGACLGHRRRR
jgi:hypothetical protein